MKALVGAFNQEKALVGAFSVIEQPVVEPMDRFAALITISRFSINTGILQEMRPTNMYVISHKYVLHIAQECVKVMLYEIKK